MSKTFKYTGPYPQTDTRGFSMRVFIPEADPPPTPSAKPPPPLPTPEAMQLETTKLAVKMLTTVDDPEDLLTDFYEWAERWLLVNGLATKKMLTANKPADGDTHIRLNRETGKCELTNSWEDE